MTLIATPPKHLTITTRGPWVRAAPQKDLGICAHCLSSVQDSDRTPPQLFPGGAITVLDKVRSLFKFKFQVKLKLKFKLNLGAIIVQLQVEI
jgi:hypothetical protein